MRVQLQNDQSAAQFSKQLLDVGNGKVPVDATSGLITLTNDFCRFVDTQLVLIENVFPNISENYKNYAWLSQRAILAAKNNDVHALNFTIQSKIAGDLVTYKSVDSITNPDDVVNYPTEFLNSLEIPGFPPHNLQLKVGTVIMILRNLNPPRLCNGTRLSVKRLMPNLIEATIINGKLRFVEIHYSTLVCNMQQYAVYNPPLTLDSVLPRQILSNQSINSMGSVVKEQTRGLSNATGYCGQASDSHYSIFSFVVIIAP
ncbi:hypothetical protein EVAR_90191_1 [Eumeta japonica]|uniref:DNA helicase Pif1-like 2B domain-containing protein n=1 Tax=Eumeta variegata TaxID=151549 RepID=A0A4C1WYH7_EUMVA|nr:hypothetical protein EVAR_90191_1 [Eumeta japonica]